MTLQILSEFVYRLVEQSWISATILVKYFLAGIVLKVGLEKRFDLGYLSEQLTEYSGEIVTLIVILGLANVFAGLEFQPLFKTFSQVTAFLYFGLLFWKY